MKVNTNYVLAWSKFKLTNLKSLHEVYAKEQTNCIVTIMRPTFNFTQIIAQCFAEYEVKELGSGLWTGYKKEITEKMIFPTACVEKSEIVRSKYLLHCVLCYIFKCWVNNRNQTTGNSKLLIKNWYLKNNNINNKLYRRFFDLHEEQWWLLPVLRWSRGLSCPMWTRSFCSGWKMASNR